MGIYIKNIIEIIVFDSIIGNSDRHQENWGVIMYYRQVIDDITQKLSKDKVGFWEKTDMKFRRLMNETFLKMHKDNIKMNKVNLKFHSDITQHRFAPIYDSGCCLGREFEDDKVEKMINDVQMIEAYIKKGETEIHWEGLSKKPKHYELLSYLLNDDKMSDYTKMYIFRVKEKFDKQKIKEIINTIDLNLPLELINYKLSDYRKILMFKLITLRIETLLKLI